MKIDLIIVIIIVIIGIYLITNKTHETFKTEEVSLLPIVGGDGSKANPWTFHIVDDKGVISVNENKVTDVNINTWIGKTIKPFVSNSENNNYKIAFPENHTIHISRKLNDKIIMDIIEGVKDENIKSLKSIQVEDLISFVIF
jgi:hypothetical protein